MGKLQLRIGHYGRAACRQRDPCITVAVGEPFLTVAADTAAIRAGERSGRRTRGEKCKRKQ